MTHGPKRSSTIVLYAKWLAHLLRVFICKIQRKWRSFKEHQAVQNWRGARGRLAWGSRLRAHGAGVGAQALSLVILINLPVSTERLPDPYTRLAGGMGLLSSIIDIAASHDPCQPPTTRQRSSKVRETHADILADMWQMTDTIFFNNGIMCT